MLRNGSGVRPVRQRDLILPSTLVLLFASGALLVAEYAPRTAWADPAVRFFFAGDGRLSLVHGHFEEHLDVRYRRADGSYDPAARAAIDRFFRSRGDGKVEAIPLRLIELLSYIQSRYRLRRMVLLSGYRSPEFNEALGTQGQAVALASLHTQALAADLAIPDADLRKLWLRLRAEGVGGVGLYASQRFLHIDVGPVRFWEETTSRVSEKLSAGNARIFARSDFDRYPSLDGARITLHSVTAFPLRIARHIEGEAHGHVFEAQVVPLQPQLDREGDCWVIREPSARYEFEVRGTPTVPLELHGRRIALRLVTCSPRVERTPENIPTNTIEIR
ncbi:MAG: hypothetical protein KatS3mg077_1610 [Candidatus Binatia bacterium]|nr:MAG: hypothetical protein KatS3mg077_1610 [Candidatus Binatia bacterium]